MPWLEARADGHCELCGGELVYDERARHPRSPSVDHIVPVSQGGDPLPPLEGLRLTHLGCNARRGNRTRRTAANTAPTRPPNIYVET